MYFLLFFHYGDLEQINLAEMLISYVSFVDEFIISVCVFYLLINKDKMTKKDKSLLLEYHQLRRQDIGDDDDGE